MRQHAAYASEVKAKLGSLSAAIKTEQENARGAKVKLVESERAAMRTAEELKRCKSLLEDAKQSLTLQADQSKSNESDRARAVKQLALVDADKKALRAEVAELRSKYKDAQDALAECAKKNAVLSEEYDQCAQRESLLKASAQSAKDARKQRDSDYRKIVHELEESQKDARLIEEKAAADVDALESKCAKLQIQIDRLRCDNADAHDAKLSSEQRLQEEIAAEAKISASLRRELEEANRSMVELRLAMTRDAERLEDLLQDAAEKGREDSRLALVAAESGQSKKVGALQTLNTELKQQLGDLLSSFEEACIELEHLKSERTSWEKQRSDLQSKVSRIGDLKSDLAIAERAKSELEFALERTQRAISAGKQERQMDAQRAKQNFDEEMRLAVQAAISKEQERCARTLDEALGKANERVDEEMRRAKDERERLEEELARSKAIAEKYKGALEESNRMRADDLERSERHVQSVKVESERRDAAAERRLEEELGKYQSELQAASEKAASAHHVLSSELSTRRRK